MNEGSQHFVVVLFGWCGLWFTPCKAPVRRQREVVDGAAPHDAPHEESHACYRAINAKTNVGHEDDAEQVVDCHNRARPEASASRRDHFVAFWNVRRVATRHLECICRCKHDGGKRDDAEVWYTLGDAVCRRPKPEEGGNGERDG